MCVKMIDHNVLTSYILRGDHDCLDPKWIIKVQNFAQVDMTHSQDSVLVS